MKKNVLLFLSVVAMLGLWQCTPQHKEKKAEKAKQKLIEKPDMKLSSDLLTPEVLWSMGRLSGVQLSPDQKTLIFGVTYYSKEENKGNRELYRMDVDGKNLKQLTKTPESEFNAVWRPDGKKIGYLSPESGSMQIWEMNPDGSNPVQITHVDGDVTGFKYAPDQKKILYTMEVKVDKNVHDMYPDLPKTSGKIFTDMMYRHWDEWVTTYSHIFVADYNGTGISNSIDIMKGEPYESPMKPFGGMEQINWTPDSKTIAYTCRKKKGLAYTLSTNSDIYFYNLDNKTTKNMTEGMMGYDVSPVFSPDGKYMAWESMEHDGYESDKNRLFVMDLSTGKKTDYSKNFDQNANSLAWSNDGKSVYFISDWHASDDIYRMDLSNGKITKITEGIHDYTSVIPAGKTLYATRMSMSMPIEVYAVDSTTGKDTQLTFTNKNIMDQLKMGRVEKRWIKTTDNKEMLTWVIYPPNFDPNKKYPALLYCEGGPQSTVSQFWSYRWNFQIMAANDYIIVAPNRRGLPGFGTKWNEEISGDYGGQNMKDYLSAIDAVKKEPFVDADRLGAVGASYGGFSIYWLAGHNLSHRFKVFIAHDGMFNLESMYLETDEMWFVNWDLGGPYWDKKNKIAQRSYANSPHKFIQNWNAPILVIHGQKDFRIPVTQGMQAFDGAILRKVPAEFLYFPDENHWVLKPQNGILWQRTFFSWLDRWLKKDNQ
ncbi:MAG: S9 family peptidase [Bacteroidales bacterium]|nr:S9 family peptidase [Bacteroidales bacterium]